MVRKEGKYLRITIMLNVEIDKKLRVLQANRIKQTNASVSYSFVINEVLSKALK